VQAVVNFLMSQPVLLVFLLVGLGSVLGDLNIKGVGLSAAAVLFAAIAFSATATSMDLSLDPTQAHQIDVLGAFGLALFTFTVGVMSGANFFASLTAGWRPILATVGLFVGCAGIAYGGGQLLGLSGAMSAGTFAGALTNTPALAAASAAVPLADHAQPVLGYAVAYIFGVLGMLAVAQLALSRAHRDTDAPEPLISRTIRVETDSMPSIAALEERHGGMIKFARVRHGEHQPVLSASEDDVLRRDDLVTAVGPARNVARVTRELGHSSSHDLSDDRRFLDYRRITVSDPRLSGLTIGELDLEQNYSARIIRVRRGDVDMLASDSLVLQTGDRVRVVANRERMDALTKYFGDSARGLADINPVGFALGIALGVGLGAIPLPFGSVSFKLGSAAGTLLVGLLFGRIRRAGPVVLTMPTSSAQAISELGILLFLTTAGLTAGTQITSAFTSGEWWRVLLLGVAITAFMGVAMYLVMRRLFKVGGTRLSGMIGGVQTQPAVLAFANSKTNADPRVALGYAMVYPSAMVVKILLGQILGILAW